MFEATAHYVAHLIRQEFRNDLLSTIGGALAQPAFKRIRKQVDTSEIGGAPLLGVNGVVIIGHGQNSPIGIKNAIQQARTAVQENVHRRDPRRHRPGGILIRGAMELTRNGKKRVVISGLGVVTPLGDKLAFWDALQRGESGIRKLRNIQSDHLDVRIGGEVPDFDSSAVIRPKEARRMGRATQFALVRLASCSRRRGTVAGRHAGNGRAGRYDHRHDAWPATKSARAASASGESPGIGVPTR